MSTLPPPPRPDDARALVARVSAALALVGVIAVLPFWYWMRVTAADSSNGLLATGTVAWLWTWLPLALAGAPLVAHAFVRRRGPGFPPVLGAGVGTTVAVAPAMAAMLAGPLVLWAVYDA